MTDDKTKRLILAVDRLGETWPKEPFSEARAKIYVEALSDSDIDFIEAAIEELIRTSRFFPMPADIHKLALGLEDTTARRPDAYQGWQFVQRVFRYSDVLKEDAHPLVQETVDLLGGWTILGMSGNPTSDRARFIEAYNLLVQRDHEERLMAPAVKRLIASRQKLLEAPKEDASADAAE